MSAEPTLPLRHTIATLAYRAAKVLRGAPPGFGETRSSPRRSAAEILAHMADLLEFARRSADGDPQWLATAAKSWDEEVARFFAALKSLDDRFGSGEPLKNPATWLFQGPIADALTHIGQLASPRRRAGSPVLGEAYFQADIVIGRVGPEQTPPAFEFR